MSELHDMWIPLHITLLHVFTQYLSFLAVLLTLLYNHTVTQQPASETPLVANSSQCSITPQMDGCYKMVKDFSKSVHKVEYKHSKFQFKLLMTDILITDKTTAEECTCFRACMAQKIAP